MELHQQENKVVGWMFCLRNLDKMFETHSSILNKINLAVVDNDFFQMLHWCYCFVFEHCVNVWLTYC